jgi:hypothetical protein
MQPEFQPNFPRDLVALYESLIEADVLEQGYYLDKIILDISK